MRKLIVAEFVTLDGVMEAPGGEPGHPHTGWVFDYLREEQLQYKSDEVFEASAQLLGRVTYESFAGAWPGRGGDFADRINSMPKYVVSTTLREPEWNNCHVISSDVAAAIGRLKEEDGGPILVSGSCTLVHWLFEQKLVDELRLMVFPVALGSGRKLFPESPDKTTLVLTEARTFKTGVLVQHYDVASGPVVVRQQRDRGPVQRRPLT
jgi:dihydrofolate reductase